MKRKLGTILILIVVLFISLSLVNRIYFAFRAGDRLTEAVQNLKRTEIKNQELKEQLKKASSAEFIEQQARDKLNFAREGETVVVIPQSKIEAVLGVAKKVEEKLPNPLGWLKLFFK